MLCRRLRLCRHQKVHQAEGATENAANLELEKAAAKGQKKKKSSAVIFGCQNIQQRRRGHGGRCCLVKMALRPFVKEEPSGEKKQIKEHEEEWADEKPEVAKKSIQVLRGIALALQSKPGNYQQFL